MKKITLLDGAVGTSLWGIAEKYNVKKAPVWMYNMEHPEFVTELTRAYVDAGSEMILTNTFGANAPAVRRSSSYDPDEVVKEGVRLVKDAVQGTDRKVVMSAGPLMQLMEPYGDLEEEEVEAIYTQMFEAGMSEKPDAIMLQTFIDLEMMKVAARAAKRYNVPVYCTMTFEKVGKTMMGQSVQDVIDGLTPLGIDGIGMNCSLGPELALPVIQSFVGKTDLPLIFKPNAGKPILAADGSTGTSYTAEMFVREITPALDYVSFIGGCCGCSPEYISAIRSVLRNRAE